MKQHQVIKTGEDKLKQYGIPEPASDAMLLWFHLTETDRMEYLMNRDNEVEEAVYKSYMELIDRRCSRVPLQYITGNQCFMGFDFYTSENVLIPRFDTEILVEKVLDTINSEFTNRHINVLDMCCGSGCIGLSLKMLHNDMDMTLADISDSAIALTEKNRDRYNTDCRIIKSDLYENINDKYDIIISNPPYIRSDVIDGLMPEVRDYEPRLALDGDVDGLKFYRRIIDEGLNFLNEEGFMFFEIGHDQAYDVQQLLVDRNFADINVVKDLNKNDRVIYGRIRRLSEIENL
jgi:release factor glutamine methyltransferase